MDIAQLIQTLVATIVGGLIVIATNWIAKQEERRGAIQEWYEKTYVTEGIEPVVIYLANLSIYFYNKQVGGFIRVKDIDAIPVEAIIRLQILFDDSIVPTIISLAHKLLISEDKTQNEKACNLMYKLSSLLLNFRKELLHVIATQVKTKHYVVDASEVVKELNKIGKELAVLAGYDGIIQ